MATLLYMEHAADDAPEGERRIPCSGSRVLLKHGDSLVAVLDTSSSRRGRRVALAHLAEDDGSIQERPFAFISKSGPSNRYVVCYQEGDTPVYVIDCPPDSRNQYVIFYDPDGSLIARLERAPQSSTYVGTFNSIAADCSLVLMSWVAVIKLG